MGFIQDVVRRINIFAKTEGVDQAAAQLRGLSAAQDGVSASSSREGQAHLSVQSKLNSLMRAVDGEYRSEQKLEAAQKTLTQARNQGLISIEKQNELMGLAAAKYKVAGEAAEGYGEKMKFAKEMAIGFVSGIGAGVLLGGLTELPAAIADTVEKLSKIGDAAETIGITTKALQELQFAASSVDVPVTTLDSAMETFSKNLAKAQSQGGALSKIFGLNGVKITGDTFTDLEHYADLVKNATNQEQRNLLITTAFGKGAADLGPMFRDGAAGIEEWARQADDAGIHTDAQIQRAHDLNQELTALKPALVDAQEDFAVMIAPAEIATLQGFNDALRQTRDLLTDIQNLDLKKVASVIGRDEGDHWSLFGKNGAVPNFLQSITSPTYGQMFPNGAPPSQITVNGGAPQQLGTAAETYDFASFFKSLNTPTKTGDAGDAAAAAAAAAAAKKLSDELARQAKAYDALSRSASQFVAGQSLAITTYGMSAEAASKLTHQNDLLNQAANSNIKLTPKQINQIDAWSTEMAQAETQAKQYTDVMDTLSSSLSEAFSQPITDAKAFFSTVIGGFAQLGQANLQQGFKQLLSGNIGAAGAANDNGGWQSARDAIYGAVRDGSKDGTGNAFSDLLKGVPGGAGTVGIGLGGLGIGAQTQNPLMGALGGALSGAAGGPLGIAVGGIAGFIGGLFGMDDALNKAKQALADQTDSLNDFFKVASGGKLTDLDQAIEQVNAQAKQFVDLANAAGDSAMVAKINAAAASYRTLLTEQAKLAPIQDKFAKVQQNAIDAYEAQADALSATVDRTKEFISSLAQFRSGLLIDKQFSPLNPQQQLQQAQQQFDLIAKKARLGDANAQGQLQGAATSYLDAAHGYLGSSTGYATIFNSVEKTLGGVQSSAVTQLSSAQAQLSVANKSLRVLGDIHGALLTIPVVLKSIQKVLAQAEKLRGADAKKEVATIEAVVKGLRTAQLKRPA